jgi:hypothetical protein
MSSSLLSISYTTRMVMVVLLRIKTAEQIFDFGFSHLRARAGKEKQKWLQVMFLGSATRLGMNHLRRYYLATFLLVGIIRDCMPVKAYEAKATVQLGSEILLRV